LSEDPGAGVFCGNPTATPKDGSREGGRGGTERDRETNRVRGVRGGGATERGRERERERESETEREEGEERAERTRRERDGDRRREKCV
jgi:hypothetical protein